MNSPSLRTAIAAALAKSQPTSVTCRMATEGNRVVRIVGGEVVQSWKRRPNEKIEAAFARVVGEAVQAGQISTVIASSMDDVELGEEELGL